MTIFNRSYILLGLLVIISHSTISLLASNCYTEEVPNGKLIPNPCLTNATWLCTISRNPVNVTNSSNPFGIALKNANYTWTKDLCKNDSDGDGLTNGQELGDPNCTWTKGNKPNRTMNITHPGICNPVNASKCYGKQDWLLCALKTTPAPTPKPTSASTTNVRVTTGPKGNGTTTLSTNSAAGLTTCIRFVWIIASLWSITWLKMDVNQ